MVSHISRGRFMHAALAAAGRQGEAMSDDKTQQIALELFSWLLHECKGDLNRAREVLRIIETDGSKFLDHSERMRSGGLQ